MIGILIKHILELSDYFSWRQKETNNWNIEIVFQLAYLGN